MSAHTSQKEPPRASELPPAHKTKGERRRWLAAQASKETTRPAPRDTAPNAS